MSFNASLLCWHKRRPCFQFYEIQTSFAKNVIEEKPVRNILIYNDFPGKFSAVLHAFFSILNTSQYSKFCFQLLTNCLKDNLLFEKLKKVLLVKNS